eukprot:4186494-Pyramimonas_sp.AAC.1
MCGPYGQVRVAIPPGVDVDAMDLDEVAAKLLPGNYNQTINRPPPSALSYNSVVYKKKDS